MSAILKFVFENIKQLHFWEENYLIYTKKTQFCMWQYIFPKTKSNKSKQYTHYSALVL